MPYMLDHELYAVVGLIGEGYIELLLALGHSLGVLLLARLLHRLPGRIQGAAAAALLLAQCGYVWSVSSKSLLLLSLCYGTLLPGVILALAPDRLPLPDGLFLLNAFLLPYNAFNSSYSTMGIGTWLLLILFTLLLYALLPGGGQRMELADVYLLFAALSVTVILAYPAMNFLAYAAPLQRLLGRRLPLLLVPGAAALICLAARFVARHCVRPAAALRRIARRYPWANRFIALSLLASAGFFLAMPLVFLRIGAASDALQGIMLLFYLMFFLFQLVFLYLLYRLSFYRENLTCLAEAQGDRAQYYRDLEANLRDMANLRHDIKNLFLTMSGYVNRSDDEEMKTFYRENIYPFALNEVEKNAQFSQLYQIPDESLRSFLYMKLSRLPNLRPTVDIRLDPAAFFLGMERMDLTRVLGILLDNALEEASGQEAGTVALEIRSEGGQVSYLIRNSLAPGHKVTPGVSSKPGHMGRGLQIVRSILDGYPQATWNTLQADQSLTQVLNIEQ